MALRVVTVKSAAGDYSSLSAAFAGEVGDLTAVGLNRQLEIDCYNFLDTTAAASGAWTTDATHTVLVTAVDNHGGIYGGSSGTSAYRLEAASGNAVDSSIGFATFRGLSVKSASANGIVLSGTTPRAERCIAYSISAGGFVSFWFNGNAGHAENCVGITPNDGAAFYCTGSTPSLYDCAAIGGAGFQVAGATIVKNCLATSNPSGGFLLIGGTWDASSTNNASADASAPGTNARASQTFTFVDSAADNYHLAPSDGGAKGFGADLSADGSFPISVDIDNAPIGSSWNIGADQTSAPASGNTGAIQRRAAFGLFGAM